MTTADRLDKLLALLGLASCALQGIAWAHLVGEWCYQVRHLKLKVQGALQSGYGYLAKSYFKRGLDALRSAILAGTMPARISLDDCLKLLSP